ncbi:Putative HMP/thiamine permease protein YkoC [Corynebacterium urogenitale]|uniref:HMP/thiamine permease protein YkoC n=1 Tax=Corynebacterium urogenitale TaxID=2487892 RepID=A0A5J6ZBE0_9CORY|nr:energy-coupling factor transporter transmembrane component T [Corynebacterium urogenitale]QFQ03033.1 Putative HMP/thiamine permease protein YkoC [Corynebacterium urogenitale]
MNVLQRIDPTTRILALVLLTTPLLLSIDLVSASVALACTMLLAPLCGAGPARLVWRGWPLLVLAPLTGIGMLFYGRAGGDVYWEFLLIKVTENSVSLAIAVTVRVLAVGLPAVVLTADLDPTRLGDGLSQLWRLPSRFVIGSVAGARLVTLFQQDWGALERAHRARGLGDGSRITRLPAITFGLLVLALRRGAKLATAMEARGFGSSIERTWGRSAHFGRYDAGVLLVCTSVAVLALGLALWTGEFRLLGVVGGDPS